MSTHRHCPRCGYDLRGVPVARARITCPECGLSVQARELPSPGKRDGDPVDVDSIAGWGMVATVGLTVLGVFVALHPSGGSLSTGILLFATMAGLLGPLVCGAVMGLRVQTPGPRESRVVPLIAWFALGVLSAVVLIAVLGVPRLLGAVQ